MLSLAERPLLTTNRRAGGDNFEEASDYVREKFLQNSGGRETHVHVTCATDTENIQLVFAAVSGMVIADNLKKTGLISS